MEAAVMVDEEKEEEVVVVGALEVSSVFPRV
jgi:hypothetical protein